MNEGKTKDTLTAQQADELNRIFELGKYADKHAESLEDDESMSEGSEVNRKVVSQLPAIKAGKQGKLSIDLFSINENGMIGLVELKINNQLTVAMDELADYSNWILGIKSDKHEFDPERGKLNALQNEHYLPKFSFEQKSENTRAIAVVQKNKNSVEILKTWENSVPLEVVELPKGYDWLKNKNGNPFESSD